jgi:hypothetical protein
MIRKIEIFESYQFVIETENVYATNTKGKRIRVKSYGKNRYFPYDYSMSNSKNHAYAVACYLNDLKCDGTLIMSTIPSKNHNGYYFTFSENDLGYSMKFEFDTMKNC